MNQMQKLNGLREYIHIYIYIYIYISHESERII